MKNNTKIKLILLGIFIILFGFLFWYFYNPSNEIKNNNQKENESAFNLFPFGDEKPPVKKPDQDNNQNNQTRPQKWKKEELPALRQISNFPTAGINFTALLKKEIHDINVERDIFETEKAWKYDDHISEIKYVAQKNGHIYSTYTNTKKAKKVSIITIPKIYNAEFWDRNHLILQYVNKEKDIKTYSVVLRKKTDAELEEEAKTLGDGQKPNKDILNFSGVFLPVNINEFSLLPNSNKIFYIKKNDENGNEVGIISKNLGEDRVQIWESKLHEWNLKWKNPKYILINSKASKETYTLPFKLNTETGDFEKTGEVLLAGNGLPNYSFTKIVYSGKDFNNQFHLYVYNLESQKLQDLGLQTLTEKCVWSKDNIHVYCAVPDNGISSEEPDNWYKGYTNFSDSIYRINTNDLSSKLIFNSYEWNKSFDIEKIYLDDFEDYIYFIDGMTKFAWSYKIPEFEDKKIPTIQNQNNEEFNGVLGGGNVCPTNLTLTENLRPGNRDGKYSSWTKKKITQVKILQKQMNRLGFGAGKIDGILGKNSTAAIKRMQEYLGTKPDALVGPKTRALLNNSCD